MADNPPPAGDGSPKEEALSNEARQESPPREPREPPQPDGLSDNPAEPTDRTAVPGPLGPGEEDLPNLTEPPSAGEEGPANTASLPSPAEGSPSNITSPPSHSEEGLSNITKPSSPGEKDHSNTASSRSPAEGSPSNMTTPPSPGDGDLPSITNPPSPGDEGPASTASAADEKSDPTPPAETQPGRATPPPTPSTQPALPTDPTGTTESEARQTVNQPPPPSDTPYLERIWAEPIQYHDVRSVLSQIWARDETVLHSILSEIWAKPAVRAVLSEIWEEAVQVVEPKRVLSEIWAEPPVKVDIRSVLSQIWSDDNKQRLMSVLSEIWSTPAVRSVLSEIWGSGPVLSILSEIWTVPVQKVDIRSVLSQIWSADHDEPPPKSILSEIWSTPAVQAVLSEIWGKPRLRSVLSEIWKQPVEKVDIRSILSQIWSSDHDEHVRSILSEIWATPAVRSVLSQIWHAEEGAPVIDTRADYRVTESQMLLEELIDNLQKSETELAAAERAEEGAEGAGGEEEALERSRRRVHRYTAAADESDLPASRPLTTRWAFGGSSRAPVINLSSEGSRVMTYAAAQCAVIHDCAANKQRILQGHRNCICGLAASRNGRWIVSGDIGPDNALIVWDVATSAPLQMHFPPAEFSGPLQLEFSCDSRYVVALWGCVADPGGRARQQLVTWDWTMDGAVPRVVHLFGIGHGFHHHVSVSQIDSAVMAATAACRVLFFQVAEKAVAHHCPQLHNTYSPDFKCSPGHFTQTAFSSDDPYSVVTGTIKGYVILWSDRRPSAPCDPQKLRPTIKKEARKVLKISEASITCLQITDGIICAGTAAGELRFLDGQLRLRQWYQNFHLAAVRCISPGLDPVYPSRARPVDRDSALSAGGDSISLPSDTAPCSDGPPFPGDASLEAAEFACRDLLVTAADGFCGLVEVRASACHRIAQFPVVMVRALDVHRSKPQLVIGAYDGSVRVYDFQRKQLLRETVLTGSNHIHAVAFSPSGLHLAVGMQCGELAVLDGLTLLPEADRITLSRAAITQCLFSPDSDLLATRDEDLVVAVYRFTADTQQWGVLGRWRAHHKPIVDLLFAPGQGAPPPPRLLSLGEDRVLVEYDLVNSTKEKPVLLCCDTLEQSAIPLCMALYPPLTTEDFILVANSQYKMKLFNAHTRMCRRVVLGPQFGAPVERIKVIPRILSCDTGLEEEQHSYLAFSTGGKIGLQILPLDGNPRKAATVIGHPGKVEHLDCSADGRWLFSAGGDDGCVFMWEIYPESLEAISMLGGTGMTPFYDQLEGGRDGELYGRLEDLVYYTQLMCQGEDVLEKREVSQTIPLHAVTDVLRAIGFFPTEKEIEDMQNEVRYRDYAATGQLVEEVHLDDIIRLYINHGPVSAASPTSQLAWALDTLSSQTGRKRGDRRGLSAREFLRALQASGEHMSQRELAAVLAELLDPGAERLPLGVTLDVVEGMLPRVVTLRGLCDELLNMPEEAVKDGGDASPVSGLSD